MLKSSGGGGVPDAPTLNNPTVTGVATYEDGTVGTPSIHGTDADSGIYWSSSGTSTNVAVNGVAKVMVSPTGVATAGVLGLAVSSASSGVAAIEGVSTNSIRFSQNGTVTTTSRTELNKAVASIANAVATDVLTVTIPNAAHSASLLVRVTGSLGAGGAIGANEATATNTYIFSIARTAGVNATVAVSAAFGAAATAVAGAATVTATAAASAVAGAVGAANTFTVQVTISRSAGSSTNHTCLVYAQLMNANATGVTMV